MPMASLPLYRNMLDESASVSSTLATSPSVMFAPSGMVLSELRLRKADPYFPLVSAEHGHLVYTADTVDIGVRIEFDNQDTCVLHRLYGDVLDVGDTRYGILKFFRYLGLDFHRRRSGINRHYGDGRKRHRRQQLVFHGCVLIDSHERKEAEDDDNGDRPFERYVEYFHSLVVSLTVTSAPSIRLF
jgi:hypothetical protein